MTYRPPFKGFWKKISIIIAVVVAVLAIFFFTQIGLQKKNENELKQTQANGILVKKRNLNRGSFLIVIIDKGQTKEFDLSGYDQFYDKINLGDSVSKKHGSFYFQIFRKNGMTPYQYVHTIGYE